MSRLISRLRPLALAVAAIALLPGVASAAGDSKPAPPAGGHDVTRPAVMSQVSDEVASAKVGALRPRGAVTPLRARAHAATAASSSLSREVMGFAKADSLGDSTVGYTTWNFNLLTDVAYFGIHVNPDGTLVQNDSGWAVWQSSVASNFISAAHASGVRVLLTLMFLPASGQNATLCQGLDNGQTTITQAAAQLKGADGIDIDYEGSNITCPDNVSLRTKVVQFTQRVRAANLGYLVIDTYAGSAEDGGGFFDIPSLAATVDAMFVMAYGLESANGPCGLCMGPTSPLDGSAPNYTWNVTRAANGYAPWAAQSILGFPYYGVAGCTQPNPPANAPVLSPGAKYTASGYTVFSTLASNPSVSSLSEQRDAVDPSGQEMWGSYFNSDPTLNCWREAYWDDALSLGNKYNLVNQRGFRGAGIFTLDFGGGSPELWSELAQAFLPGTFASLGGRFTSSPAAASWGRNRLDVFGRGTDNVLYHAWGNGFAWSGWESLGGTLTEAPAVVSWGPGRLDVFVRGTDNGLWHRWYAGGWSGWESLGGTLTGAPAVASWASGRLDVFARGTDNALYHRWYAGGWSGWEPLGGQLASGPGAVSWGLNRIDVFARATDNSLLHRWWDGASWNGPEARGGTISATSPAPSSTRPNQLDVYATGVDGTLSHTVWTGSAWVAFAPFGPATTWQLGPASVAQPGAGFSDVFTIGADNAMWHAVS
jgi:spore germination protein YaaH